MNLPNNGVALTPSAADCFADCPCLPSSANYFLLLDLFHTSQSAAFMESLTDRNLLQILSDLKKP